MALNWTALQTKITEARNASTVLNPNQTGGPGVYEILGYIAQAIEELSAGASGGTSAVTIADGINASEVINPPAEDPVFGTFPVLVTDTPQSFPLANTKEITVINKGAQDVIVSITTTTTGPQNMIFPAGVVMTKRLAKSQGFITQVDVSTSVLTSNIIINHSN